jgi:predicted phage tail protein
MSHSVVLTWVAPAAGDPVANYDVQKAVVVDGTLGAFVSIGSPTGTTLTDTNVTPGEQAEYRVASVNTAGESSFITTAVLTIPLAIPQPPTNLEAAVS